MPGRLNWERRDDRRCRPLGAQPVRGRALDRFRERRDIQATSPATGEVIAPVAKGGRADAQRAVEAAHRARPALAALKGFERSRRLLTVADAIERRREELGRLLTLDQGKPLHAEASARSTRQPSTSGSRPRT